MCLFKNKLHAGVPTVESVTNIVNISANVDTAVKCPGYDQI